MALGTVHVNHLIAGFQGLNQLQLGGQGILSVCEIHPPHDGVRLGKHGLGDVFRVSEIYPVQGKGIRNCRLNENLGAGVFRLADEDGDHCKFVRRCSRPRGRRLPWST